MTATRIPPIGDWAPPSFLVEPVIEYIEAYKDTSIAAIAVSDWRQISNELHDLLQAYQVVVSGFDASRTCSVASYGAIIDYSRLSKLIYDYPEAHWDIFVAVEESDSYLSPSIGLLASWTKQEAIRQQVKHAPKADNESRTGC